MQIILLHLALTNWIGQQNSFAQSSPEIFRNDLLSQLQDDPLYQAVTRNRGNIVFIPESEISPKIAGRWDRKSKTIYIYLNKSLDYQYYKEILRHESVHMAQYCNGVNQGSPQPMPIGAILSDEASNSYNAGRSAGLYHEAQQILEMEAYTLEQSDDQEIISFLDFYCTR